MKRIAVGGLQHESNSFSPFGAKIHDFEIADGWPPLSVGKDILTRFPSLNIPIGGFLGTAAYEFVPLVWASAEPSGPVSDDAFERISTMLCRLLKKAGSVDGVYLDLHGAMVTQSLEDAEGELLYRLRSVTGCDIPIVVSLDMHANITQRMVTLADAMTVYRTYPHIDMAQTGIRSQKLMQLCLEGQRPCKAFRKLPYLVPLSAQCTDVEPFKSVYGELASSDDADISSVDIAAGFPASDIYECGPAVIAYGRDQGAVDLRADRLYNRMLAAEPQYQNPLVPIDQAVREAIRHGVPGRPVILADVQDNPGVGGTSDTTSILQELITQGAKDVAAAVIWDPTAAGAAQAAGVGAIIETQLGSRFGYDCIPLSGRFAVEALSDGRIVGSGTIQRGVEMNLGPMAQLRLLGTEADLRIVVASVRYQCLDQSLFVALGIEPAQKAILVIKSTVHFRADFEAIAGRIIMVRAPGANPCSVDTSVYRRLRRGMRGIV